MDSELEVFTTPSLGDNSYLLAAGSDAVLVDPQRDAWRFLAAVEARGLSVRHVLETHVHNDYVSGALEVRAATGAEVAAPARGGYEFPHRRMTEGDEIRLGGITLQAMETPGHTPEHISYVLFEDGQSAPVAVFTGGSLMVGGAGRTDLLGDELKEELARAQYRSLRRLAELPDDTAVLPTHGAGSFCAAGPASKEPTSTLGQERLHNPALLAAGEEDFLRDRLSGLLLYPAYYRHMAPLNRAGAPVLGGPRCPVPLPAEEVARLAEAGTWIVDGRDRVSFASSHLPGSINVELDDAFATYVGWVVPFDVRLVLVLPEPIEARAEEALTQLLRIGYERVEGYLAGGVESWRSERRELRAYPMAAVEDVVQAATSNGIRVLDVRQPREWEAGSLPGSMPVFVGDLPGRLGEIPRDAEVWAICASGRRAALAASLLDRAGIPVRLVARQGVTESLALLSERKEGR